MSTYLLAIVIGDLRGVTREVPPPSAPELVPHQGAPQSTSTSPPASGTPRNITVWGTPDQIANLEFAADAAAAILPAYEAAFGTAYTLPKLDLVAIPDFSAGAMENWGLITYRQTALLVSPTSSLLDRRAVAKIVAHEISHQWFGNLVTMAWWNDLWLNEGFASYLEYLGATAAQPDGSYYETFYVDDDPYALKYDSKAASHPMSLDASTVLSTDRIESLFDPVEYERGGSVLRMLRAWINRGNASAPAGETWEAAASTPTADPFLQGLTKYLHLHAFNSTVASDLWPVLSEAVGVDLGPLMEAWTYVQGYPLLTVSIDAKRGVWLQQAPFSLLGPAPCDAATAWWVPVAYISSEGPATTPKWAELNACQSLRPLIPNLPKGGWIKVNARQYGYYRVNYAPELWEAAAVAAGQRDEVSGSPVMRGVDYAGLIEDAFALSEAGELDATTWLTVLSALPERPATDYAPWATALPYVYKVDDMLEACQTAWRSFVRDSLLDPFMRNASLAAGGGATIGPGSVFSFQPAAPAPPSPTPGAGISNAVGLQLLRPPILKAAGYFGDPALGQQAANLLPTLTSSSSSGDEKATITISPDLRSAVYQTAARAAPDPQAAYDSIKAAYIKARDPDERQRTLLALGYSPLAVPTALEFALSQDVRPQDIRMLVVTAATVGGAQSLRKAWDWFVANWDRLHTKLGGGKDTEAGRRMGQILEGIASVSADEGMVAQVDALFEAHKDKQSEPGYSNRAKESIVANAAWVKKNGDAVCAWLQKSGSG